MASPLVFGIGMNKTGTSSLTAMLYELGWPCLHSAKTVKAVALINKKAGLLPLDGLLERYSAFCDSPINYMFRELDEAYPGSRFILTVREEKSWIISRISQFGGTPKLHRQKWNSHVNAVREYFAKRPKDLLEYNLCGGAGWTPICQFLGVALPKQSVPHKNKTGAKRLRSLRAKFW